MIRLVAKRFDGEAVINVLRGESYVLPYADGTWGVFMEGLEVGGHATEREALETYAFELGRRFKAAHDLAASEGAACDCSTCRSLARIQPLAGGAPWVANVHALPPVRYTPAGEKLRPSEDIVASAATALERLARAVDNAPREVAHAVLRAFALALVATFGGSVLHRVCHSAELKGSELSAVDEAWDGVGDWFC